VSAAPKINKKHYDYQVAFDIIDEYIANSEEAGLIVAWVKAQLVIRAQARFYELAEYDEDVATALAWEDFDLACRARGEPCITGAVFQLWSRLPKKKDKEFKEVLNRALAQAQYQTDPRLFRYPERARLARIQTLEDGFDEAEATPLEFRDIQAWVSKRDAEAEAKTIEKKAPAAKLTLVDVPVLDTMPGKSVDDEDDIF
jgi:hypothetical protein